MIKPFFFLIALTTFLPILSADIGPGPDAQTLPYVVLDATYAGQPVPDGTVVTAYCFINGELSKVPTTTFDCMNGVCKNSGWYKLSPCVKEENASAIFEFNHPSLGAINTTIVPIKAGTTYYYNVKLNADGTSEVEKTGEETNKRTGFCFLGLFLPLLAIGIIITRC